MPSQKNITASTSGYSFEFVSEQLTDEFQCDICLGKGKKAYEVKRSDGEIMKVGEGCLRKYCRL